MEQAQLIAQKWFVNVLSRHMDKAGTQHRALRDFMVKVRTQLSFIEDFDAAGAVTTYKETESPKPNYMHDREPDTGGSKLKEKKEADA